MEKNLNQFRKHNVPSLLGFIASGSPRDRIFVLSPASKAFRSGHSWIGGLLDRVHCLTVKLAFCTTRSACDNTMCDPRWPGLRRPRAIRPRSTRYIIIHRIVEHRRSRTKHKSRRPVVHYSGFLPFSAERNTFCTSISLYYYYYRSACGREGGRLEKQPSKFPISTSGTFRA